MLICQCTLAAAVCAPGCRALLLLFRNRDHAARVSLAAVLLNLALAACCRRARALLASLFDEDSLAARAFWDFAAQQVRLAYHQQQQEGQAGGAAPPDASGGVPGAAEQALSELLPIPPELLGPLGLAALVGVSLAVLQALDLVTASDVQRRTWCVAPRPFVAAPRPATTRAR